VIELNRAVAVAAAESAEAGLAIVDRIGGLDRYYLFHATRADLLRRLARIDEAAAAYGLAAELAPTDVERAFLRDRLAGLR
jgi:RNA polymerase sigma-70 factor (ECF subfamily)